MQYIKYIQYIYIYIHIYMFYIYYMSDSRSPLRDGPGSSATPAADPGSESISTRFEWYVPPLPDIHTFPLSLTGTRTPNA